MSDRGASGRSSRLHVLVVDDDAEIRDIVSTALQREGIDVQVAADVAQARASIRARAPDVVVVDVDLPDASGLDLLREVLVPAAIPTVVLTAHGDEIDRVLGLELGADDYVVKPFFPRELSARVRRAAGRGTGRRSRLDFGELVLDLDTHETWVHGRAVALTGKEFELLAHLAVSPRRVYSRDDLLRDVWESSSEWQSPKTVTEHVRRLRTKLEDDPRRPHWIVSVRGHGYAFHG